MRALRVNGATRLAHAITLATALASLLVIASLLAACGGQTNIVAAPAPRPRAVLPSELFPEDLDLVVRIDAARVRQNPMLAGVVRDLAKSGASGIVASAKGALEHASAVWIGTRWMSDGFHGDGIVAVEGPPGTEAAPEENKGIRTVERSFASRSEPALEVIVRDRGVVLATAAEADAVLRVVSDGPDEGRLDPPARGLVSFAGRVREGAALRGIAPHGLLRNVTNGLVAYSGSLEERDAIDVEATLVYASPDRAAAAARAGTAALERLATVEGDAGKVASSVKLTEVGSSLQVRATVPFAWLGKLH